MGAEFSGLTAGLSALIMSTVHGCVNAPPTCAIAERPLSSVGSSRRLKPCDEHRQAHRKLAAELRLRWESSLRSGTCAKCLANRSNRTSLRQGDPSPVPTSLRGPHPPCSCWDAPDRVLGEWRNGDGHSGCELAPIALGGIDAATHEPDDHQSRSINAVGALRHEAAALPRPIRPVRGRAWSTVAPSPNGGGRRRAGHPGMEFPPPSRETWQEFRIARRSLQACAAKPSNQRVGHRRRITPPLREGTKTCDLAHHSQRTIGRTVGIRPGGGGRHPGRVTQPGAPRGAGIVSRLAPRRK
jgi:hypothetical protein